MNYFGHPHISNSDIKSFKQKLGLLPQQSENIQAIFDFGSLFHATILEPSTVDKNDQSDDAKLARKMKDTFFRDEMCRMIILRHDFKREREFYEKVRVGKYEFNSRCKADGDSEGISLFLELKGLNVDSEKAFNMALERFDYDQAVAHYMLTAKRKTELIVGISKKKPKLLFKKVVKMNDDFFAVGEQKLIESLDLLHDYSPDDIMIAA
jgi:hypothetical protein